MTNTVRILLPTTITAAMLGSGSSIPEPAAVYGEVAWVSGAAYTVGQERTHSGSVYACTVTHTGSSITPPFDPARWLRKGPTLRMAPFDDYTSTLASSTGALTYVIYPGVCDGIKIYGAVADHYTVTVRDGPGGPVIATSAGDFWGQAIGLWELAFGFLGYTDQVTVNDLPFLVNPEVTISLTSEPGVPVSVGDIKVGTWKVIAEEDPKTPWSGRPENGATSEHKTYTTRKTNPDGTYKVTLRPSARNVKFRVVVDKSQGMYADALLKQIIGVSVPVEVTNAPEYGYLNVRGFVSATLTAITARTQIDISIEGTI